MTSYETLKEKNVKIVDILKFHIDFILDSINRKITEKQAFKNPWKVFVERSISRHLFLPFYKAIKNFHTETGRTIEVTRYKSRLSPLKEIKITFIHIGTFVFYFGSVSTYGKEEIRKLFCRKWKSRNKTEAIAIEDNPIVVIYKVKAQMLKVIVPYKLTNQYGTVCSH